MSAKSKRNLVLLIDQQPEFRLLRDQRVQLCTLLGLHGKKARHAVRELLIIIRQYRVDDARFQLAVDPTEIRSKLETIAAEAVSLREQLAAPDARAEIKYAHEFDNLRRPSIEQRTFDFEQMDRLLAQVQLRAMTMAKKADVRRRGHWPINSNSHNPPRQSFLSELLHLWHAELGLPISADVRQSRDALKPSRIIKFCQVCCIVAGEEAPRAITMRNDINTVRKAMDAKPTARNINGELTLDWRFRPGDKIGRQK